MNFQNITQHFRSNEQLLLQRYESILEQVENRYAPYLTSFLDPRECYILTTLVNRTNLKVKFEGGFPFSERKRALIYPDYFEPKNSDYEIKAYEIKYSYKFNKLKHQNILGTLLGAGIKREQLGDIVNDDVTWQFVCTAQIGKYLEQETKKIGNVPVLFEEIKMNKLLAVKPNVERKRLTITSLRLDNIIANVYNISRQTTKQLIKNERCKVNFAVINDPDYKVDRSDMISVRGFGRFQIQELDGMTKKGRNIIQIIKFK